MNRTFQRNSWSMEGLTHAWSIRFAPMPEFHQQDDYIENPPAPVLRDGYSYVSLLTTDKISPKVKLTTHCSFEGRGAPLVVLPKKLIEKDGRLYYGDYLEVVLWQGGINVWNLWMEADGSVTVRNLLRLEQPVQTGVTHELSVEIQKDRFIIHLDGVKTDLYCGDIYDRFHLGITGCEGPCRFYDMTIEHI